MPRFGKAFHSLTITFNKNQFKSEIKKKFFEILKKKKDDYIRISDIRAQFSKIIMTLYGLLPPLITVHIFFLSHVGDKPLNKLGNCFSIQFHFIFFFSFSPLEWPLPIAGKSDVWWSWNQYFHAMSSRDLWFETPLQFFF